MIKKKIMFFLFVIFILLLASEGVIAKMKDGFFELPVTVEAWTRTDSVRIIDSTNIFDYMNGAGELYLAYFFNRLEVFKYTAENKPEITVEIYRMKTSDEAQACREKSLPRMDCRNLAYSCLGKFFLRNCLFVATGPSKAPSSNF